MSGALRLPLRLRFLPLLAVFAALLLVMGTDSAAPEPAFAAGAGSCTGTGACVGATATIGANSCNGQDACKNAKGVIGDNACNGLDACIDMDATVGNGSCNGDDGTCTNMGLERTGAVTVAAGSCNGNQACWTAGSGGTATIAAGSCLGELACGWAGEDGSATIAAGSCIDLAGFNSACQEVGAYNSSVTIGAGSCITPADAGAVACYYLGSYGGHATAGAGSCLGSGACSYAVEGDGNTDEPRQPVAIIGARSCNGEYACQELGDSNGGKATIGDDACNGYYACFYTAAYTGVATIGDDSCNGYEACYYSMNGGEDYASITSSIGKGSCNGDGACYYAGYDNYVTYYGVQVTIGDYSCNGEDQCVDQSGTVERCTLNLVDPPACSGVVLVTPASFTVTYGDAAPKYTFTAGDITGPYNDWLTKPVCTSNYTAKTPVSASPVKITCSGGDADGREVVYAEGSVTIGRAALTVQPEAKSWTLGTAQPAYTFAVSGFENGETVATAAGYVAPSCGPLHGAPTVAGSYTIVCGGGSAANYAFVYEGAVLTVTGSLPPTPPPPPSPTPAPKVPSWQQVLISTSSQQGYTYAGDCQAATTPGTTCSVTSTRAAQSAGAAGEQILTARLHLVLAGGALSPQYIAFEFRGSGLEWLLVSQTGSLAEPASTPVRPAPAPPNTGTGTGGGSAAWLLVFGALAMAAGGAAVWGRSRR